MASEENASFDDSPIITYSNRIQKHMFKLTEFMGIAELNGVANKRTAANQLILLIQNLPPAAKEKLGNIYDKCRMNMNDLTTPELFAMYGEVSNWIYENILQDAFKARPRVKQKGHLSIPPKKNP